MIISPAKKPILKTVISPIFSWQVILYNCNCHIYDEVIEQIIKAIGCSYQKASQLTSVAHQLDSVSVYKGEKEDCKRVADILGNTGLLIEIVN